MAEYHTVFVPGKVYWAKIIGQKALHDNYDGDAREWSYELVPDDVSFLKDHRLLDRLKDKEDPKNPDKGDFLNLKKPELDKDGNKNDPIPVYDADNEEWDGKLLGNGTAVVAKLTICDWGKGKKKSIWTSALMVTDLVPYEGGAGDGGNPFAGYGGKVVPIGKAKKAKTKASADLDDLDDDVPF